MENKLNIKKVSKKSLLCFVATCIAMFTMGLYSSHITKKIINNNTFDIRTKIILSELKKLDNNEIEQLQFEKSSFFIGSIINSTDENLHMDKLFCDQLNNDLYRRIIHNIEIKTPLSLEIKNNFRKKLQLLMSKCKRSLAPTLHVGSPHTSQNTLK